MRQLFLSLGLCALAGGAAWAQSDGSGGSMPVLPVGQVFKQFEFPIYQDATLKAKLSAVEAKGITLNRVETTDLRIDVYDNGAVTTTITSPDADLYLNDQINERKMRTKNTVLIDRSDMTASSQDCDFDLKNKKYVLRTNVKVVLKNFDFSMGPSTSGSSAAAPAPAPSQNAAPAGTPAEKPAAQPNGIASPMAPSLGPISPNADNAPSLDNPGAYSDTNSAPLPPTPVTK